MLESHGSLKSLQLQLYFSSANSRKLEASLATSFAANQWNSLHSNLQEFRTYSQRKGLLSKIMKSSLLHSECIIRGFPLPAWKPHLVTCLPAIRSISRTSRKWIYLIGFLAAVYLCCLKFFGLAVFIERQFNRLLDSRASAEGYPDVLMVHEQQLPKSTEKCFNQPAWPPQ